MTGMTRAFRDAWLQKCTDGSYTTTRGELMSPDDSTRRCCLGVAIAVGEELKLLEPGGLPRSGDTHDELLTNKERDTLGIGYQERFASANDDNQVPEGMYYPQEVIDLIKTHPVID